jgi:hypothetical protein
VAELKKDGGIAFKGTVYRAMEPNEELIVTCENCGQRFKITVPRTSGGMRDAKAD